MHHKIVSGLDFSQNGPKIGKRPRLMGGFGNYYESEDEEEESNMTNVRFNHIPLTSGLSHAVRLELGSNPNVMLGPERKVSDADEEEEAYTSSSSDESNASSAREEAPAEIQPLYKEEPSCPMERKPPKLPKKDNPMLLYNTTRSKDVLQLQLAMQKQTEFDEQNRDMDHRLHCIYKPGKKKSTSPPSGRKRSRSNSPVPQFIDLSSSDKNNVHKVREPPRRLKSPPNTGSDGSTPTTNSTTIRGPTTARGSPILQESYVRRPHKNKRANSSSSSSKQAEKTNKKTTSNKKSPPKKPSPTNTTEEDDDDDNRFKRFQNTQWHEKFEELLKFRRINGHCQVPHTWPPNPQLARWVKRQRYQFKLRCEGKLSTMTEDRVQLLNEVGFVWDSHAAAWQEKYEELKDYVNTYKTFNMGNSYSTHPQLATWVKCQRRQYKLLMLGQESNMTAERKDLLEKLGFLWGVRNVQPGGKK